MPGVTVRVDDRHVAYVVISNEAKLNTLNRALMDQFLAAIAPLAKDENLRAVVVAGAGERAFIGGADIDEMARLNAQTAVGFITHLHLCCDALRELPVPVIARIQGYALGAGLEMAAACDLRIVSDTARFGMPEVKVGIPSVIEAALLPGLIGWGRTRRLLFLGETIDAAQAERWGLVETVVPMALLDEAVERALAALLEAGPRAIRLQKALLRKWENLTLREAVIAGIESFSAAWETPEPGLMMAKFRAAQTGKKLGIQHQHE